jgi:hypothetical protein
LAAHTERQIPLPADLARWQGRVRAYEERIDTCWQKYARRNRELAHLAANLLILLALLADCHLICGEDLRTLRTKGTAAGCGAAGATGATPPPCAGSSGACSATSA